MDNLYSLNNKDIKEAAADLLNNNAETLINYIYHSTGSVYINPEVRIGLSIRILAKTHKSYDEALISLILADIEALRNNTDYLLMFKDPKGRRQALDEEYALVQGYVDMDDTISLNQEQDTTVETQAVSKLAADSGCIIV
jgi:hypothetical protein